MLLLVLDGAALIGIVVFSVLAALERDNDLYIAGQIAAAVIILACVGLLRRANHQL
jgi:hypothetical protein